MLAELQACNDRKDLAVLLGVSPKELAYTLYLMPNAQKYAPFCISKKNGGSRNILAPNDRLKWLQRRLLDVLYECEDDIRASVGASPNLHFGFRREQNIFENAYAHRKCRFVLNIDISNYFDQFNFGRVRGFFIHDHSFRLKAPVATTIAQIASFANVLPQGSPCSPHIANLASRFFDIRMARFLRSRRCRYTRYADDITISTNNREFPVDVAILAPHLPQGWDIAPPLRDIFARADLPINDSKIRMSSYPSRQVVTGLVVNDRPNVTREYYLTTRAMCHNLFKTGTIKVPELCDGFGNNCQEDGADAGGNADPLHVLEGRLSHIHYIRERTDNRSIQEKQDNPTQFWKTLQRFYLYKYFFGNQRPLLLTEGPSDVFYVKSALQKTTLPLNQVVDLSTSPRKVLLQFFNFAGVAANVLGLTGGAGNIKRFLYIYHKESGISKAAMSSEPVIILIDNDSGGADVINMVNGIYKTAIKIADPEMVHKVTSRLYLVKTNHVASKTDTCIEDMLPANVRNVKLNGKTFSSGKKFDTTKHFGKVALANYVKVNSSTIDLTGLNPLLLSLNEAVETARAQLASNAP